jgi:hypothetical protein
MGVSAYGRIGVWAYGRMGVWAYGRMGVSACRRALHHCITPLLRAPGFEDEDDDDDENEGPAAGKPGLAIGKNVN